MTTTCGKCGGAEFTDAGKCKACKRLSNQRYLAKRLGMGKAATSKTKSPKAAPPAAVVAQLVIEHGYGLTAAIDEDYLIITQHDGELDKDDKICVSRFEFRQLVDKFGPWAA